MKTTIENRLGIFSGLAIFVLIVAGWLSYRNTQQLIVVNGRVAQTNEVLAAISQAYSAIQGAQNRATDFAIVRDERYRNSYYASVSQAQQQFDHLRNLTSDNPRQQARLDELDPLIENAFSIFHLVMNQPLEGKSAAADTAALRVREEQCLDDIRRGMQAMEEDEHRLLEQRNAESAATARSTIAIVALGSVLALGILILAGAILHYDIARRLKAERALTSSEERYRTLFENAPVGIYRTTPGGRILAGNPALVRMLGYPSFEEMAERNLSDHDFEPEYSRSQFMEMMEERGEVAGLECVWHKRDGDILHVRENARASRDDSGKIIYYEGTLEDITQRRRAEAEHARLVTAIEQSEEAVVITNTEGIIEYINPAFTQITGYEREEVLGKTPRILKSDKQDMEFYRQLWATILRGEIWHGEIINRRKDGKLYTEEMNIAPVRGAHGEVTHFVATKQDVTERKTLEAQLQQAAKIEAVGRLAGGVAHDFNNLLTIINGYTELLLDKYAADGLASTYLTEVKNAGERAASLTRQLLAFSRRQVLAPQVIDLNAVVSNLEKMLKRLIGEDIKLHTLLDPSLERLKADPGQIEQVIMNLAVNARDAMPSGGNLTIETRNVVLDETYARSHATVKPGPYVMLAVGDTGVGMTPETKAHIFEPFFTTKEKGKGTGLGLATVYGIVKQSGGSVWVYSELGQGTVFKVYLPIAGDAPATRESAKAETDSALGTETILVIEDEEGVRSLIHLALESAGYKVLQMEDAEAALATCVNYDRPIHLLLTDVVMPQMSGPVVAEKVAALRPGIKILYMSGYTDDAVVHHGVLSHDMPFIQKPFSPVALRKKIRDVLGGKQVGTGVPPGSDQGHDGHAT
jgi:PAS domain S-box-containing protein